MTLHTQARLSLFSEGWAAIKQSRKAWLPVAGILCVAYTAVYFFLYHMSVDSTVAEQLKTNPQLFKQHPELAKAYFHASLLALTVFLPLIFVIQGCVFYAVTVTYLRSVMVKNPPVFGGASFGNWLKKALWRHVKPLIWLLIPIIGMFFYWRSWLRYCLVTPLAVLGRGPELQRSWDLTKGNWWRIFLSWMGVSLVASLVFGVISLIPGVLIIVAGHMSGQPMVTLLGKNLGAGIMLSGLSVTGAIFMCTTYRVLLAEQKAAAAPSIPNL